MVPIWSPSSPAFLVDARASAEAEFLHRQELWASRIEESVQTQLSDVRLWQEKRREIDVKMEELRRREIDVRRRENQLIKCVSFVTDGEIRAGWGAGP